MNDYDRLFFRLLDILNGDILPLPHFHDLERNEQRIAIAVCDATGMTPERWDKLDHPSRSPWIERTIAVLMAKLDTEATLEPKPIIKRKTAAMPSAAKETKGPSEDAGLPGPEPYPVIVVDFSDPAAQKLRGPLDKTGSGQQASDPPALTESDAAILKVLLQAKGVGMTHERIGEKVKISDKTIRTRMKYLRELKLVHKPLGIQGNVLTEKGSTVARELPTDAGAKLFRLAEPGR